MAALATGVTVLSFLDPDADKHTVDTETKTSVKFVSQMATIAGLLRGFGPGRIPTPASTTRRITS